mmetsp:Transcript_109581/g.349579  ORF Transcript_109581/g.349579 Transcript_109581/m.349579 type:complete len:274 (-) Transcript_109581:237-1058(-)
MLLCAPPICQPATHFLGCFSLRIGATVALSLDFFYGLALVILHALLLGSVHEPRSERQHEVGETREASFVTGSIEDADRQKTGWALQYADLDFGFGHQLLGLPDQVNMVAGLIYGVVVILVTSYMLQPLFASGDRGRVPSTARFFTNFIHLQLFLYIFIALVKLPKLCSPIQKVYLTHLYMECHVLWFVYIKDVVVIVVLASFSIWMFSSFSFVLTFGHNAHQAVRPECGFGLDSLAGQGPAAKWRQLPPERLRQQSNAPRIELYGDLQHQPA